MAVEPLNRISLRATSLADDLGFVALADLARVLKPHDEVSYRVIGGQMVMVLAARWGLGAELYRVTLDTDLGTPPLVVRDHTLVERLAELGYNRFPATNSPNLLLTYPPETRPIPARRSSTSCFPHTPAARHRTSGKETSSRPRH